MRRRRQIGRRAGLALALALVVLVPFERAPGAGTPAGTVLTNSATLSYSRGGRTLQALSNSARTPVLELLDSTLVWQDAADVAVAAGDTGRVLTFTLVNTGNGADSYRLAFDAAVPGDQFDPLGGAIYLDDPAAGNPGVYDPGIDPLYVPGVNDPALDARVPGNERLTLFVVHDIPDGVVAGQRGASRLEARSNTGTGAPGSLLAGAGEGGVDAALGASGGTSAATGAFEATDLGVQLLKSAAIDDGRGGSEPVPGAVITYRIEVSVRGTGTVTGLVVTDPVPAQTRYVPRSIRLDGDARSDEADGDGADFGVTQAGAVSIDLGDVAAGVTRVISFQVSIE